MAVNQNADCKDYLFAMNIEQEYIMEYFMEEENDDIIDSQQQHYTDEDIKCLLNQGIDPNEILELYPEISYERIFNITLDKIAVTPAKATEKTPAIPDDDEQSQTTQVFSTEKQFKIVATKDESTTINSTENFLQTIVCGFNRAASKCHVSQCINDLCYCYYSPLWDRDINIDVDRYYILDDISINITQIVLHHQTLKQILSIETEERSQDIQGEYWENLYFCGCLLYFVRDVKDVEILWNAKEINFDTHCGFDVQFLVGAGVDETIAFCNDELSDAKDYLIGCKNCGDFAKVEEYVRNRLGHYSSHHNGFYWTLDGHKIAAK